MSACITCGGPVEQARFCAICGAEQPAPPTDGYLGRVIGERYEIRALIGVGGMGRVYRAVHRVLDRAVAIKFIHRELLTNEDIVTRFMTEARAASRLNHPNVVSIHDFGRTPPSQGGDLYCVMELLSGPSLARVLEAEPMPLPRIADVLCQVLAALAEAHREGITHRDVKPANILLDARRSGGDHVKVIDFGVARLGTGENVTRAGQVVGTPSYMAPEQARGEAVGPFTDLYAVGVLLFRMLTGQRPFAGATAEAIIAQHLHSPRPDPRKIAPDRDIPERLAGACVRAMDLDPARRHRSAEELARLIVGGAGQVWGPRYDLLFPVQVSPAPTPSSVRGRYATHLDIDKAGPSPAAAQPPPPAPSRGGLRPVTSRALPERAAPVAVDAQAAPSPAAPPVAANRDEQTSVRKPGSGLVGRPLVGRAEELAWARGVLARPGESAGIALCGRAGVGRTRLLEEIAIRAERAAARVLRVTAEPPPQGEVSCSGLRALLPALIGPEALATALKRRGADDLEYLGLSQIFTDVRAAAAIPSRPARQAPAAVLSWALRRAVASAAGAPLLLAIDDVDRLDGVSQSVLADVISGDPIRGLTVAVTSEKATGRWLSPRLRVRQLSGLSLAEAMRWGGEEGRGTFGRLPEDVEPLHLELLERWCRALPFDPSAFARLSDLVEWRVRGLSAPEQRVLQAIAVLGSWSLEALTAVISRSEDVREALPGLERAGLVTMRAGSAVLDHVIFGRVALAVAPSGAIADLHARAAEALAGTRRRVELRAFHAVRGRPDTAAFLLLAECAQRRTEDGDPDGCILALWDGVQAARSGALGGDHEAIDAWIAFGQKLGDALIDAGRLDEAFGVLHELLDLTGPDSVDRAMVLERVARVAQGRGRLRGVEAEDGSGVRVQPDEAASNRVTR